MERCIAFILRRNWCIFFYYITFKTVNKKDKIHVNEAIQILIIEDMSKTHLMHSIDYFILEQNPETKILYVTSESFTNEVIESIRSGNATAVTKLREKYRTVDVLMIDDIQFIIGKESTQEEFSHTFNVLHSAENRSSLPPINLPKNGNSGRTVPFPF